jgi:hypothetical protein
MNAPDGGAIFTMALPTTTGELPGGETGEAGTDETGESTDATKQAGGSRSLWVS